ncbi:nitroreductase family protein [Williamsia sp. DF01-3]|uniref:nitroreductase family protein n=1 Tax=Williamsia sp. DF01-3 TaxID=2934157 RepID=UPI001FF630B9|nr:nitroreductase family protein [Williamsia sp. DF01-3]MCK0516687.1 nitroreductase family protein [Williamsia sp. DF01-3]
MGDLQTIQRTQRACRRFDPDQAVQDSDLQEMLEAAVHAPSAENTQPWRFVVVRDPRSRGLLASWWSESWRADYVRQNVSDDVLYNDLEFGLAGGGFASAPVIVVVCADVGRVPEDFAPASIFPAVQNMLLAANDLEYGSCLTTGLTIMYAEQVRQLLGLPDELLPMAAVYIGRPARTLAPPRRTPAAAVTFRERYGSPW